MVTGRYGAEEAVPKRWRLKNRTAHLHVLKYMALHIDHVECCSIWEIAAVAASREPRKKIAAKPLFAESEEAWLARNRRPAVNEELMALKKRYGF